VGVNILLRGILPDELAVCKNFRTDTCVAVGLESSLSKLGLTANSGLGTKNYCILLKFSRRLEGIPQFTASRAEKLQCGLAMTRENPQ
jgi:hypothetical protein